jgi:PAS domain-containing protein
MGYIGQRNAAMHSKKSMPVRVKQDGSLKQRDSMENVVGLLESNEDWLMDRILEYAIRFGYAKYTSTLKEAWRLSISGMTSSIVEGIRKNISEIEPEDDFSEDPVAMFGIIEAQRHRERGVSLSMFLGLMKYYRQTYIDLMENADLNDAEKRRAHMLINRIFDRVEIGFCVEWSGSNSDKAIQEMQISNRMMTNEKNKYLTIFESIPSPVIILNSARKVDNMNIAAARLLKKSLSPGSQYYCQSRDRQLELEQYIEDAKEDIDPTCFGGKSIYDLFPWIENAVEQFNNQNLNSLVFEKEVSNEGEAATFRIKLSKTLDISGKFDGTVVILDDITTLKNALEEVHTLRGFLPICSHCKNVRDDKGFWQKVEAYISDHSEARFSHSICPECAVKYYPGFELYEEQT